MPSGDGLKRAIEQKIGRKLEFGSGPGQKLVAHVEDDAGGASAAGARAKKQQSDIAGAGITPNLNPDQILRERNAVTK